MPPVQQNNDDLNNDSVTLKLLEFLERHKQDDKEDRRLMYKSINEHGEAIAEMMPLLKDCHKDLNGNGHPGVKKVLNSHVSVQKWVSGTVIAVISGVAGLVIANWSTFLTHFYTFMKIIEWWNKNNP